MPRFVRSLALAAFALTGLVGSGHAQTPFVVWPGPAEVGVVHDISADAPWSPGVYDIESALDPFDGFTSRLAVEHGGMLTFVEIDDGACAPDALVEVHAWDIDRGLWMHQETARARGDGCIAVQVSVAPGQYAVRVIGVLDARLELATTVDLVPDVPFAGGFDARGRDRFQWYGSGDGQVTVCTDDGAGACPGDTTLTAVSPDGTTRWDDDGGVGLCSCLTLDADRDWTIDVAGYAEQAVPAYVLSAR